MTSPAEESAEAARAARGAASASAEPTGPMRLAPLDMYAESALAKRCVMVCHIDQEVKRLTDLTAGCCGHSHSQPIPILDEQLCIPGSSDALSPASLELPMGAVKRSELKLMSGMWV